MRVFREAALAVANASDKLRKAGVVPSPLSGIPVSVKDLTDVARYTTKAGSASRKGDPPVAKNTPVLARLRAAGAVVTGTTNMTEYHDDRRENGGIEGWWRLGRRLKQSYKHRCSEISEIESNCHGSQSVV